MYPREYNVSDSIMLFVVGDTTCTGYVENTFLNYHVNFTVDAGAVTQIAVPFSVVGASCPAVYPTNGMLYHHNGLFLHTSRNVCVYVSSASTLYGSCSNLTPRQCGNPPVPYAPLTTSLSMMSYKIPIYPLHFSVSDRLNMEYMFKYTIGLVWYHGFCNITALEDSTVVYSCRYNAITDTILLDLAGGYKFDWGHESFF